MGVLLVFLYFSSSVAYDVVGGLEGRNQDKIKYVTSLNTYKEPPSLEEVGNKDSASNVVSDNTGSECNNDIVTYTEESDDGIVKPSSPSVM